jgi:hypothetical protein
MTDTNAPDLHAQINPLCTDPSGCEREGCNQNRDGSLCDNHPMFDGPDDADAQEHGDERKQ